MHGTSLPSWLFALRRYWASYHMHTALTDESFGRIPIIRLYPDANASASMMNDLGTWLWFGLGAWGTNADNGMAWHGLNGTYPRFWLIFFLMCSQLCVIPVYVMASPARTPVPWSLKKRTFHQHLWRSLSYYPTPSLPMSRPNVSHVEQCIAIYISNPVLTSSTRE